jgi:hypothetical protein
MANLNLNNVRPGDLIMSSLWNQVLSTLQSHEDRISALEGATSGDGAPLIFSYTPASSIHVQDEFTLFGQNFGLPGTAVVTIDSSRVTTFEVGSNDGLLKFQIPPIVVNGGKNVTLTVTTSKGSKSISFFLLPAQSTTPTGDLAVAITAPSNTTFAAGKSFTLNYTITATTTLSDTYDLLPAVSVAGWQSNIVDSSGAVISNPTVFIGQAQSANKPVILAGNIQVVIPSGATGSANLTLTVRSQLNPTGLVQTSGNFAVVIGSSPVSSPNITVVPAAMPPRDYASDGRTLLVPTGVVGLSITFNVSVTATATNYAAAARVDTDSAHWHLQVTSPVAISAGTTPIAVPVTVNVDSGAAPSNLYLKITSPDGTQATEVSVPIQQHP